MLGLVTYFFISSLDILLFHLQIVSRQFHCSEIAIFQVRESKNEIFNREEAGSNIKRKYSMVRVNFVNVFSLLITLRKSRKITIYSPEAS